MRNRRNKTELIIQILIVSAIIVLILSIVFMVKKWGKGQESDYDPDEVTTEYDTEPTDYVLPLSASEVEGKEADDKITILTLGNSPFADDYPNNNLAAAFSEVYDADVINGGIEGSYITCKDSELGDHPEDGVSLYNIAYALTTGDYTIPDKTAADVSDQATAALDTLKNTDLSKVDAIFIMYDLEDYVDHRPLGSESDTDVTCIYGAIKESIKLIREAYPYIRVVYLSQPASGKTIDDFYVDGDLHNIGEGLLSDYVTFELTATANASASFVDIYYGAINVDQRDEFIVDDYHINYTGAASVAERVHKLIELTP